MATILGLDEISQLLVQTLDGEKNAEQILAGIAEKDINYQASEES